MMGGDLLSFSGRRPTPEARWRRHLVWLGLMVAWPTLAQADGSAVLLNRMGCLSVETYGIAMFGTGAGSVTVNPPGPIAEVWLHWVGVEDETPPGPTPGTRPGTSTLTVNGAAVIGTPPLPPADLTDRFDWYSWYADIGPTGLDLVNDLQRTVDVSDWDSSNPATNGASVTVIYDIGPCTVPNTLEVQVGVDWYFHNHLGDEDSEMLTFTFAPQPVDRAVVFQVSHAGTDANQTTCRGGAIWMRAGIGAPPGLPITERAPSGRNRGINGGIEIVNDPFTATFLPCVPTVNPLPDEAYESGHPCPNGGDPTCPYRALSIDPPTGGDIGPEFAVLAVEVLIPAGYDHVEFVLESEHDQNGESGSWAGASYVFQPIQALSDPPVIVCAPCERCADLGTCTADISCESVAVAIDPQGDPVTVTCDPPGPFPLGTTAVTITATSPSGTSTSTCPVTVRDCEPPECEPPANLALECTSRCGVPASNPAIVGFLAGIAGSDGCGPVTARDFGPPLYAAGCGAGTTTTVGFSVTDGADYERTCTADVTVRDTLPPALVCPPALALECQGPDGVPASHPAVQAWLSGVSTSDLCSASVATGTVPPFFPVACGGATTSVPFTATDACGNSSTGSCAVTVVDTTPPELVGCGLSLAAPAAPAAPCAASSAATIVVDCGSASDRCGSEPIAVTAELRVRRYEVEGGLCTVSDTVVEVDCGEELSFELMAPACPAGPSSASSPPVVEEPPGTLQVFGHELHLTVNASDACGNAATSCEADAAVLCLCAAADCEVPVCGQSQPFAGVPPARFERQLRRTPTPQLRP